MVYSDTVSVVTWPTGQFVTVGAHDVIVTMFVEYTVDKKEVVISELKVYVDGMTSDEVVEDTKDSDVELGEDDRLLSDELVIEEEGNSEDPDEALDAVG